MKVIQKNWIAPLINETMLQNDRKKRSEKHQMSKKNETFDNA